MSLKRQGRYQFNGIEIDLASRSLRRDGHAVAVSRKTFDLLTYFILNAQRVVTTDELMRELWDDAHMEESNLSQHMYLLRQALTGTEPGSRLIVSVPGEGYRMNAEITEIEVAKARMEEPVEPSPTPEVTPRPPAPSRVLGRSSDAMLDRMSDAMTDRASARAARASARKTARRASLKVEAEPDSGALEGNERAGSIARFLHSGPLLIGSILGVVVLLAVGGWFGWRYFHRPGQEAMRPSMGVMIADFDNSTGNANFDLSIRTALSIDLGQSPFLRVSSQRKVADALETIRTSADKASSAKPAGPFALVREVCHRLDDRAYLTGDIHRLAEKYMITLQAMDCGSGKTLAESRGIAETPDGVVAILDRVAADLRGQLGEPRKSVERFSKPLFAERAASLEALKAYSDASSLSAEGKFGEAASLLRRAIEVDPKFALAYADLGAVQANLGERDLALASLSKAYELRNTVDDENRFFIVATYNELVTGDLQASVRNAKQWSETYPRNPAPFGSLAVLETEAGKPALALEPARRALELDPSNPTSYEVLARAQMHLDRFEEAAATCRLAMTRHLDTEEIHGFLLQIAFLRLDEPAIDEQMEWFKQKPAEPYRLLQQGLMDFAEGKAKAGQATLAKAAESYRTLGQTDEADRILGMTPRIVAELGLVDAARTLLNHLPEASASSAASTDSTVAWAEVGETTRAANLLEARQDNNSTATLWKEDQAPQITAAIALKQHHPEDAIEALQIAAPYDLRSFDVPEMRGKAYLAANQPELAEAEFHKVLDHTGIEPLSHNYALARLGLARALAQQDKRVEADYAYKVVFEIWKEADPDLPRLKEAKAEYARLSGGPVKSAAASGKPSAAKARKK